jgi:competence protein ComEC
LKKGTYIVCVHVFLFFLANEACYLYQAKNDQAHYSHFVSENNQSFIATIEDVPVTTEKFIKLSVKMNAVKFQNNWHYTTGKIIVYLKNDSSKSFAIGNAVLIHSKFSYVNLPKNPAEFNYKEFLENKNIFHVAYAKPEQLFVISNIDHSFSIDQLGAIIKANVVSALRNSGLSKDAFSICSALLVGYDDEIDKDVMQSFSHSGTLHILSVSGMHTGVLYGLFVFLFSLFDKHDKRQKLKCLVVILGLALFVFITGFSPAVLRAALMLALVLLGKTFYKQGNAYNTLFLSAFILLLFNPYLLKDIGFLLSYCAVFGIMYLYPILDKLYYFENKLIRKIWGLCLMSVSATVFTLPISLYFFHQFPTWFIFSNLLIIPISMLMMIAAIILVCAYKIIFLKQCLVYIINTSTSVMLWLAQLTDNPNYGYIDYIPFTKTDAAILTIIIGLGLTIITLRQYKHIILFFVICSVWLTNSAYQNYIEAQQQELVIFHVKQKKAYALRVGQIVYTSFDNLSNNEFQRYIKPYLLNFSNLKLIPTGGKLIRSGKNTVVSISQPNDQQLNVLPNYIILSKNTSIELVRLSKIKPLIIADCSNSYTFVKEMKQQCALSGIPFYSIKEQGSLQIKL